MISKKCCKATSKSLPNSYLAIGTLFSAICLTSCYICKHGDNWELKVLFDLSLHRMKLLFDGLGTDLSCCRVLVQKLETVDIRTMSNKEKIAFWINIHNAMMMHVTTFSDNSSSTILLPEIDPHLLLWLTVTPRAWDSRKQHEKGFIGHQGNLKLFCFIENLHEMLISFISEYVQCWPSNGKPWYYTGFYTRLPNASSWAGIYRGFNPFFAGCYAWLFLIVVAEGITLLKSKDQRHWWMESLCHWKPWTFSSLRTLLRKPFGSCSKNFSLMFLFICTMLKV